MALAGCMHAKKREMHVRHNCILQYMCIVLYNRHLSIFTVGLGGGGRRLVCGKCCHYSEKSFTRIGMGKGIHLKIVRFFVRLMYVRARVRLNRFLLNL